MQGPPDAWFVDVEKLGIISVLALVITSLVRKWFAPWYVITMLEDRIREQKAEIAELKKERDDFMREAFRGASTAKTAVELAKHTLG